MRVGLSQPMGRHALMLRYRFWIHHSADGERNAQHKNPIEDHSNAFLKIIDRFQSFAGPTGISKTRK